MERLGVYSRTWHTGLHIKVPFIEKRRGAAIDLREQILVCGEGFNHRQYHNHGDERQMLRAGIDGNYNDGGSSLANINATVDPTTKNLSITANRSADPNREFSADYNHSFRRYGHDAMNHAKRPCTGK